MFKGWSRYHFSKLTDSEKLMYESISNTLANCEEQVEIDTALADEAGKIIHYVLWDNPGFFYLDQRDMIFKQSLGFTWLGFKYFYPKEEIQRLTQEIKAKIADFINNYIKPDMNPLTKQILVYKYLRDNIKYDPAGEQIINIEDHNITGPLLRGKCVCEGIAKAYKVLCDHLEISSIVVMGEGIIPPLDGPHTWNITRIDGVTAHCDATYEMSAGGRSYCYFNLTDEEMKIDHAFDTSLYPACGPNTINYFSQNGLVARDRNELHEIIAKNADKKAYAVKVLFSITDEELPRLGFPKGKVRYNFRQNVVMFAAD